VARGCGPPEISEGRRLRPDPGAHIHWPDLDEDLTVAGLLAGQRLGESPQSLKKWLDSRKARSKRRG